MLDDPKHKQLYLLDSNVLLTRFLAPEGVAEISDFMPVSERPPGAGEENIPTQLVRRAKTVRGELRYRLVCAPRFGYGQIPHKVEQVSDHEIIFTEQGDGNTFCYGVTPWGMNIEFISYPGEMGYEKDTPLRRWSRGG